MSSGICVKYGCDFQVDLDGQVTCTLCGAMDNDKQLTLALANEGECKGNCTCQ